MTHFEPIRGRAALAELNSLRLDELRCLAARLASEARLVRALLRVRSRRPQSSRAGWTLRLVSAK